VLTHLFLSVTEIFHVYHEGQIDFRFAWSYMAIANNFSQMVTRTKSDQIQNMFLTLSCFFLQDCHVLFDFVLYSLQGGTRPSQTNKPILVHQIRHLCYILVFKLVALLIENLRALKFFLFTFRQSILIAILVKFDLISVNQWPYFPTLIDTVNGLQVSFSHKYSFCLIQEF